MSEKPAPTAAPAAESQAAAPEAARGEAAPSAAAASATPVEFPDFKDSASDGSAGSIDMLMDVDLEVKIELGRSQMAIDDVLRLKRGSVVELDKLAGDPVDILVNDRLVARGEILVVNDNFCVRVTEIIDPEAGLKPSEKHA
jgi:flagellar motor switch protein FliN/FliY